MKVFPATHSKPRVRRPARRSRRARVTILTLVLTCMVIVVTSAVELVEFTESNTFCGEMCHTVMAPQFVSFQESPHSSIDCVDCHVGPGVTGFLEAKLTGSVELLKTVLGTYDTPIASPVHNLPDTEGTCLTCHSRAVDHGVKPKVITRFAEDEANTETKTALLLDVGGSTPAGFEGMHWHADPDVRIRYRSDTSRRNIAEVEMSLADGTVKTYRALGTDDREATEWRTMDCIDCHNRPTHNYESADAAVDRLLERGLIADDLPFLKREAVRALEVEYGSHAKARRGIADHLRSFYASEYGELVPERLHDIREAGRHLGSAYARNVHPEMRIGWRTYPDHRGHDQSLGCFRCHAGNHVTDAGERIGVDCRICHTIVAWDEATPETLDLIRKRDRGEKRP